MMLTKSRKEKDNNMAEFFDKKEEVLDIQLTQHGKYLLSRGEFDPKFYAFFDDDIIYDTEYAGFIETQNAGEGRIFDAPRPKTQYVFHGVETKLTQVNNLLRSNDGLEEDAKRVQITPDRYLVFERPLGNSETNSTNAPSWKVDFLNSEISSSMLDEPLVQTYTTSSTGVFLHVPQVNTEYRIVTIVDHLEPSNVDTKGLSEEELDAIENAQERSIAEKQDDVMTEVFSDNSYIRKKEDRYVLIDIREQNTEFLYENFDIEVFKVETDSNNREILHPLSFKRRLGPDGKYGLPIEADEHQLREYFKKPTTDFVEYYFDVQVDEEIDIGLAFQHLTQKQVEDLYVDPEITIPSAPPTQATYDDLPPGDAEEPC
jgi:hypothetical protein